MEIFIILKSGWETDIPVGEVYHCVEGGNGELGFYLISDGGRTPFGRFQNPDPICTIRLILNDKKAAHVQRCHYYNEGTNAIVGELDAQDKTLK